MRIDEILSRGEEPVFSFEFFPPKTPEGERNLQRALDSLSTLQPDFASVTYGAGGSTRDRTLDIVREIKDGYGIEAMAHLSCVGTTAEELQGILDQVHDAGIDAPQRWVKRLICSAFVIGIIPGMIGTSMPAARASSTKSK